MDPDAATFNPFGVKANNALLVIRNEDVNGASNSHSHNSSPHDLIVEETLGSLIRDVRALGNRCNNLEAASGHLNANLRELGRSVSTGNFHTSATKNNLTAYPSSENSSPDLKAQSDNKGIQRPLAEKVVVLQHRVDDHTNTINQILEKFHENLNIEKEERIRLGKQVDNICREMINFKGRIGSVEHNVKSMQKDIQDIDIEQNEQRLDSNFAGQVRPSDNVSSYLNDKVEKLQGELNIALLNVENLDNDVKATGVAVGDLQTVVASRNRGDAKEGLTQSESKEITAYGSPGQVHALKKKVEKLTSTVALMTKKAEQEQNIDNSCTRDALYKKYHDLSKAINDGEKGLFSGNEMELWALRDRVVRRLAMFDSYGKALQEAKNAPVNL